ncbi:hypothetical protein DFQ26_003342 [Actinomortierella ambigua]|nr:hypothetical protein DFQ26_003342 [Actinomortierella ambigua]
MRISTVLVASAALALFQAAAQVAVQGKFPPNLAGSFALPWADTDLLPASIQRLAPPSLSLPPLSNADLIQLEEEETQAKMRLSATSRERNAYKGAYQFGKALDQQSFAPEGFRSTLDSGRWMPLSHYLQASAMLEERGFEVFSPKTKQQHQRALKKSPQLLENDETMVWQLEIVSKGALSLNLIFSAFELPEGAELYVTGRKHVLGAFTGQVNHKADGTFATAPLKGDRLLLQVFMPSHLYESGILPRLELSHVIHGYRPMLTAATRKALDDEPAAQGQQKQQGSRGRARRPALFDQTPRTDAQQLFARRSAEGEDEEGPHVMSGKCNLDVACFHEYRDQSRSVGVILTDFNQKYCTGSMINNARHDGRQLFLTAYHCTGFSDTSEHLVMFNYEKTECGATGDEINEHDTAQGLVKLGAYMESDYTLYEIIEPIPDGYDLYLSGWSASPHAPTTRVKKTLSAPTAYDDNTEVVRPSKHMMKRALYDNLRQEVEDYLARASEAVEDEVTEALELLEAAAAQQKSSFKDNKPTVNPPPTPNPTELEPIFGIHHPGGDIMKVSFVLNGSLPKTCWTDCATDQYYHWQIPHWDRGTTEPGSSGSPLFDADKRIVGQLHGGTASCYNTKGYDVYGGLHASFRAPPHVKDRLSTYLDPEQTGTQFMDGYGLSAARAQFRARMQANPDLLNQRQQGVVDGDYDEFGNFVIRESMAGAGCAGMNDVRTKPLGERFRPASRVSEERKWWDRLFG